MEMRYTWDVTILPSQLDPDGRLGVANTFDLFMDVATQAAGALGVGWDLLKRRGLFWITVKTRIEFLDPPKVLDRVQVVTWPEAPGEKRCNRHYEIRRDGEVLVRGKTEWAIVSMLTRRPQPMDKVLPQGLEYPLEQACPEPFPMIDETFDEPPFAWHRVTATDIDMARHMNNVAYVRAIQNAFSVKAWKKLDVRSMDVVFRASAVEGDELSFQSRRAGDVMDLRGSLPDGTTNVLARLRLGRRAPR